MTRVCDRDMRHDPFENWCSLMCSGIQPLPTPSSIASCITPTGSPSRARACAKPPPSVRSLTTSPPTDLMTTSSREPASAGGRDHRNPWPASIGTGGRLRSESTADFVGMRSGSNRTMLLNLLTINILWTLHGGDSVRSSQLGAARLGPVKAPDFSEITTSSPFFPPSSPDIIR
jgi:hypothetical protein